MYDEVEAMNVTVLAVAQEDTDLESHGKFLKHFDGAPRFELAADLERQGTGRYQRTSTYLISEDGEILQVFPATIHHRPSWSSVLGEVRTRLDTSP